MLLCRTVNTNNFFCPLPTDNFMSQLRWAGITGRMKDWGSRCPEAGDERIGCCEWRLRLALDGRHASSRLTIIDKPNAEHEQHCGDHNDHSFHLLLLWQNCAAARQLEPSGQGHRLFYGPDVCVGNSTAKLLRGQSSRRMR